MEGRKAWIEGVLTLQVLQMDEHLQRTHDLIDDPKTSEEAREIYREDLRVVQHRLDGICDLMMEMKAMAEVSEEEMDAIDDRYQAIMKYGIKGEGAE